MGNRHVCRVQGTHPRTSSGEIVRVGVTYYSQVGRVSPLPAPARMERVEDKGTLLVLTPERFTANNPEHVALAERVRVLLDRAGLLGPPLP